MQRARQFQALLATAAIDSGRSRLEIVREVVRLRLSVGQIGLTEYFDYRLHYSDLTFEQKREFIGWRAFNRLEKILADDLSLFLSFDKLTSYALFKGCGITFPPMKAVYGRNCPRELWLSLQNRHELNDYLSDESVYPIYVKPSHSSYGKGNALLARYDNGDVVQQNGSRTSVADFCESIAALPGLGWILQEPLQPHRDIVERCGEKVSGVRVMSFNGKNGPEVFRAIWKINVGTTETDNFHHGASGNMIADIDIATGVIRRVISGVGSSQQVNPIHPVTGHALEDFGLPYWKEIKEMVCQAHLAFPGFIIPGWDVAICDDGPVMLEVNACGDIDLTQHAERRGLFNQQFLSGMEDWGIAKLVQTRKPIKTGRREGRWREAHQQHWSWF